MIEFRSGRCISNVTCDTTSVAGIIVILALMLVTFSIDMASLLHP